jgi:hypothetical protein
MTCSIRRLLVLAAAVALIAAACGTSQGSASPSSSATASLAPTGSLAPSTVPTPSAEPTTAPSSSPASSQTASSSSGACAVLPSGGQLASDRLVDLKTATNAEADQLTFVFGNPSLAGPAGSPVGSLAVAKPPFTRAGSGAAIDLVGEHAVQIRFSQMSITNDAGEEVYQGPPEIRPNLPALRDAVLYDASEGIVGWYISYDGPGCVTLTLAGNTVVVTIAHA